VKTWEEMVEAADNVLIDYPTFLGAADVLRAAFADAPSIEWCEKHGSRINADACEAALLISYRVGGDPFRLGCRKVRIGLISVPPGV